jgi:hypothetical protein
MTKSGETFSYKNILGSMSWYEKLLESTANIHPLRNIFLCLTLYSHRDVNGINRNEATEYSLAIIRKLNDCLPQGEYSIECRIGSTVGLIIERILKRFDIKHDPKSSYPLSTYTFERSILEKIANNKPSKIQAIKLCQK